MVDEVEPQYLCESWVYYGYNQVRPFSSFLFCDEGRGLTAVGSRQPDRIDGVRPGVL